MKRRGQKIKRLMGRETGGDGDKGPLIGLIDRGWRGVGGRGAGGGRPWAASAACRPAHITQRAVRR